MPFSKMPQITLITIGNELLKGTIVNTNASDAGRMLRESGFSLDRVLTVGDEREAIMGAIRSELITADVVLCCGGLGPTRDDITKHTLAEVFGGELVLHGPTRAYLEDRYARRGRKLEGSNLLQAMVPESCEVVPNPQGTAPGMLFRQDGKFLLSMPGVPFEMRHMVETQLIPLLKANFPPRFFRSRMLRLFGIPESRLADRMETIIPDLPGELKLAYLPGEEGIRLELSVEGDPVEAAKLEQALGNASVILSRHLEDVLYSDENENLEVVISRIFHEKKLSLAIAESLTGGMLTATVVSVSGASDFLKGSVTAYETAVKIDLLGVPKALIEKHTVVSAEVAQSMAEGVRNLLGADIGLATTGLAETGSEKEMPHAWLGYADRFGTDARHETFVFDRKLNIRKASFAALYFCIKNLRTNFV
jgi:nicotinamide-nucleotide amidase